MEFLNLPSSCKIKKVIPKNAFDAYTNTKQKKLFIEKVNRITWLFKLSKETINLEAKEAKEIQIFKVELKEKEEIQAILDIIDKSIPYPIIFLVQYEMDVYFSTSVKHPNPINDNISVIDWNFKSHWMNVSKVPFQLHLKISIDEVYKDFCVQLEGNSELKDKSLIEIVEHDQSIKSIEKKIEKLKSEIKKTKQFNKKVALNLELKELQRELDEAIIR